MIFNLIITKYTGLEVLMNNASQFLIFVFFRHMCAQSIFGLECFLAMVTSVAEMTRKVDTLNMVPEITDMRVFFSTDVAFVAKPPIL